MANATNEPCGATQNTGWKPVPPTTNCLLREAHPAGLALPASGTRFAALEVGHI